MRIDVRPFVVILALGVAVAGCSNDVGTGDDSRDGAPPTAQQPVDRGEGLGERSDEADVHAYDDMVAELLATREALELPPGAVWPDPPPEPEPQPDSEGVLRGTSYQPGVGQSTSEFTWFCLWSQEWLDQRGVDPQREAIALDTLRDLRELRYYQVSLDEASRELHDGLIQQAELGDPTGVATFVRLNCQFDY